MAAGSSSRVRSQSIHRYHRPRPGGLVTAFLTGVTIFPLGVGPLGAQDLTPDATPVLEVDRPTFVTPWKGPPGTRVTVRGELLPAITPVHVSLGGTRTGFEALILTLTSRSGGLEETVEIPQWARNDRVHRFIISDAYFSPLALSAIFHVIGPDGTILRVGRVAEVREGCVVMDGDDEERYSLTGTLDGVSVGDRLEVEALILEDAPCAGGVPVRVMDFKRSSPTRDP